jgi:hypothetical protein
MSKDIFNIHKTNWFNDIYVKSINVFIVFNANVGKNRFDAKL